MSSTVNVSTINVNNRVYKIRENEAEMTLLTWLREVAGLTGAKCGCGVGQCGSCNVLVDGKVRRSCVMKMSKIKEESITTIEGVAENGKLHPVQEAFLICGVLQCGYCTPAQIITVIGLLNKTLNPTRDEIDKAFKGTLCRCASYPRVLQAIDRAAAIMRGESWTEEEKKELDKAFKNLYKTPDAVEKITGSMKYTDDYYFENMMFGKVIMSEYPHARLIDIDTEEAEKMPGVDLIMTHKNMPDYIIGALVRDTNIIAKDKVRHVGEPVAIVFADSQKEAEEAAKAVKIQYEELEGVFTPERALEADAPKIHEKGNITHETRINKGQVDQVMEGAHATVENSYFSQRIEHTYIETECSIAKPNELGGVDVYTVTQSPFHEREEAAHFLGIDEEKIRVTQVPVGGSFGGKDGHPLVLYVSYAAMKTGRPAKIYLDRKDSFRLSSKRHPWTTNIKIGANKDGKIQGMDIDMLVDGGAYTSFSTRVLPQGVSYCTGPYNVENLRVDGKVAFTNNLVSGAMRGYGSPQVLFAAESAMDELALELGMSPVELRKINGVSDGSEMPGGQILGSGDNYLKTIEAVEKKYIEEFLPMKEKDPTIGIGVASGWRHTGGGLGPAEESKAALEIIEDGMIKLKVCCAEMGNETQIALATIAADLLEMPFDKIVIEKMITDIVPWGGAVMASRGLILWGTAVEAAAKSFKEGMIEMVSDLKNIASGDIEFTKGQFTRKSTGDVICDLEECRKNSDEAIEFEEEIALPKTYYPLENANRTGEIPVEEYRTHPMTAYVSCVLALKVDEETKIPKVLKIFASFDVGTLINPDAAHRQAEGGVIMGLGHAMSEDFVVEEGKIVTDNMVKYKIPDMAATPDIEIDFVDSYEPLGPLGAKGIGEVGNLPIMAAVTNAYYDSTGIRVWKLPLLKNMK